MINRTAPTGLAPGRGQKLAINALKALANPAKAVKQILRRLPGLPVSLKLELDLYDRPAYAFGIARAALEAKALGIESIVVVELGVASGRGLLAMEQIAGDISRATGVKIGAVGFDTGRGLPPPADYRDLPYLYSGGFYPMDSDALRRRIGTAELVIGDVRETVPDFLRGDRPPIGFVAVDLDYYSSTRDALQLFTGPAESYLPRVLVYLDDIANAKALQTRFTGELLAIEEFNHEHEHMKIDRVHGLAWKRPLPAAWNDQMYAWHRFDHPAYGRRVVAGAEGFVGALT
jgi:hypothetical protein